MSSIDQICPACEADMYRVGFEIVKWQILEKVTPYYKGKPQKQRNVVKQDALYLKCGNCFHEFDVTTKEIKELVAEMSSNGVI